MKKLLIVLNLIFITTSAFAAGQTSEVEKYVDNLVTESIGILENGKLSTEDKTKKIKSKLQENLDFKWMAKFTLGRAVKTLPKKNVDRFVKAYSDYLISTYARGLKEYRGQTVEIKSYNDLGNNFFIVKTHVIGHTDNAIHVDYLTRKVNGTFKVRDIITEGISLVNSQRSEYAGAIENNGLEDLIQQLERRSKDKPDEQKK